MQTYPQTSLKAEKNLGYCSEVRFVDLEIVVCPLTGGTEHSDTDNKTEKFSIDEQSSPTAWNNTKTSATPPMPNWKEGLLGTIANDQGTKAVATTPAL